MPRSRTTPARSRSASCCWRRRTDPIGEATPDPLVRLDARATTSTWRSGSEIDDAPRPVGCRDEPAKLGLNHHVAFIHCKFLLHDPLGADPIVVTGSANFSEASTNGQRREHGDRARRPSRRRHLLHRVQPALQPLLLPVHRRTQSPRARPRRCAPCERSRSRGRQLAAEVVPGTLRSKRVDLLHRGWRSTGTCQTTALMSSGGGVRSDGSGRGWRSPRPGRSSGRGR